MQVFFIVQGKEGSIPTSRTLRKAGFRISSAIAPALPREQEEATASHPVPSKKRPSSATQDDDHC